jgi:hypothetical protein
VTDAIRHGVIELFSEIPLLGVVRMTGHPKGEEFDNLGPVSHRDVDKTFQDMDLFKYRRPPSSPQRVKCQYQVNYIDLIWHADLHIFREKPNLVVAFISDLSRNVISWQILPGQEAVDDSRSLGRRGRGSASCLGNLD